MLVHAGTPEHTWQLLGQFWSIHNGFFVHSPLLAQPEHLLCLSTHAPAMKELSGYNTPAKMKINVIASIIVHLKIIWMVGCDFRPQLTTVWWRPGLVSRFLSFNGAQKSNEDSGNRTPSLKPFPHRNTAKNRDAVLYQEITKHRPVFGLHLFPWRCLQTIISLSFSARSKLRRV